MTNKATSFLEKLKNAPNFQSPPREKANNTKLPIKTKDSSFGRKRNLNGKILKNIKKELKVTRSDSPIPSTTQDTLFSSQATFIEDPEEEEKDNSESSEESDTEEEEADISEFPSPIRLSPIIVRRRRDGFTENAAVNSIKSQIVKKFKVIINLEAMICLIWKREDIVQILLRDTEDYYSLIEIFPQFMKNDFVPGNIILFNALLVSKKITPKTSQSFFSVIYTMNKCHTTSQVAYYILRYKSNTTSNFITCTKNKLLPKHLHLLCKSYTTDSNSSSSATLTQAQVSENGRYWVRGKIFSIKENEIINLESTKIKIVSPPDFLKRYNFEDLYLKDIILYFLKEFQGCLIFDEFSLILEDTSAINDDEDVIRLPRRLLD